MNQEYNIRCKHDWNVYSNDRSKDDRDRRSCLLCGREEQLIDGEWKLVFAGIPSKAMSAIMSLLGVLVLLGLTAIVMVVAWFLYHFLYSIFVM